MVVLLLGAMALVMLFSHGDVRQAICQKITRVRRISAGVICIEFQSDEEDV